MKTEEFLQTLKNEVNSHAPNFGDRESVLTLLYESYAECSKCHLEVNTQTKWPLVRNCISGHAFDLLNGK